MVPAVLRVAHTAILAISTPDDENNYYSKLVDAKYFSPVLKAWKKIFHVLDVGLSCAVCRAKRKACPHVRMDLPAHLVGLRQLIAEALVDGDETTRAQEMLGVIQGTTMYCFDKIWIDSLFQADVWWFSHDVKVLHVAIDPHGGGSGSETAICALAREGPYTVVKHAISQCAIQTSQSKHHILCCVILQLLWIVFDVFHRCSRIDRPAFQQLLHGHRSEPCSE